MVNTIRHYQYTGSVVDDLRRYRQRCVYRIATAVLMCITLSGCLGIPLGEDDSHWDLDAGMDADVDAGADGMEGGIGGTGGTGEEGVDISPSDDDGGADLTVG